MFVKHRNEPNLGEDTVLRAVGAILDRDEELDPKYKVLKVVSQNEGAYSY